MLVIGVVEDGEVVLSRIGFAHEVDDNASGRQVSRIPEIKVLDQMQ